MAPITQTPIDHLFADTTVDAVTVFHYVREDPGWLKNTAAARSSQRMIGAAHYADHFEYYLKRYVVGADKTLYHVFADIRDFMDYDQAVTRCLLPSILSRVETKVLDNEWYELMPRLEKARRRINQQFAL